MIRQRIRQALGWAPRYLETSAPDTELSAIAGCIARGQVPSGWRVLQSSAAARVAAGTWQGEDTHLKVFLPRGRSEPLKSLFRGSRGVRAVDRSIELARDGLATPRVLAHGWASGGHEFMLTRTVHGSLVLHLATRRFGEPELPRGERWALLRRCGREIARLHQAGWVHGDLRLSNMLFGIEETGTPSRLWFLDNEGCRRTKNPDARLRNLIQMAMIDIRYQGPTDRMRLFSAYADQMGLSRMERRQRIREILEGRRRRWSQRLRQGGPKARYVPGGQG